MVSPYAIRLISDQQLTVGRSAGNVYFLSTMGSSAGTIMTSFYFTLWFGLNEIILAAVTTSVFLALTSWAADRVFRSESK